MNIVWLIVGLALLIGGADLLVRGMSAIARVLGVPPLVVGLTLVAFGTSLPEVIINTVSARQGKTDLAFGNIVGSCSINIGFVLALTAIISPLRVQAAIIVRELPMMLLAVAGLIVLSEDRFFNGAEGNTLVRGDGVILLLLFGVFVYYVIKDGLTRNRQPQSPDAMVAEVSQSIESGGGMVGHVMQESPMWKNVAMGLTGLVGVAVGGRVAVVGAVGIAHAFRIPENIIGLTLVSFGTTLPELATSVMAGRRGQGDIAIGNIVGSNIFNMLFIAGLASTISPISMPEGGQGDLLFLAAQCVLLLPIAIRGPRMITRGEGIFMLLAYLSFVTWRTATSI